MQFLQVSVFIQTDTKETYYRRSDSSSLNKNNYNKIPVLLDSALLRLKGLLFFNEVMKLVCIAIAREIMLKWPMLKI